MPIPIGTQFGGYEITSFIGKGGMGEVYRARDSKLKRDVAIKVLPDEFSRDSDRLSRFQREAEALAALNHPNIAAIYDFHESAETRFLVLEFVEGDTLADLLQKRGPLPLDDVLHIAKQICDALSAAHEKGIVHRDLKPANVKIDPESNVKVLDFGLAKAMSGANASGTARSRQGLEGTAGRATLSNSPTLTMAATNAGVILGTAAYMSPEQAKGRSVDRRTDIFSLGCVLYEMLTGRAAFDGEDAAEILARVIEREPDWSKLPHSISPRVRETLQVCLEKDQKKRWRDAADIRIALEQAIHDSRITVSADSKIRRVPI